jgi:hypothetical protein
VSGDYFIFVVGEISKWRWDNQTPEPGYGFIGGKKVRRYQRGYQKFV